MDFKHGLFTDRLGLDLLRGVMDPEGKLCLVWVKSVWFSPGLVLVQRRRTRFIVFYVYFESNWGKQLSKKPVSACTTYYTTLV